MIGFFGSIFESVGKACILKAFSKGPAGQVSALVELNNVLLVVFEAARLAKLPKNLELLGFLIGMFGAMVLCIPDELTKLFKCFFPCCFSKPKDIRI